MSNKTLSNIKDEELVQLYVETQKNQYFEEIYDRYADKVYRKCYSFVKDSVKAQDYTHDIFIKLAVKIGTFKETARFSTWLYSITYNYCMDQLRLIKKRSEYSLIDNYDVAQEESEDYELLEMQVAGLKESMMQLSAEEQAILVMKYQEDFSIKEISETFELSESAVKMRLMRTKEKVKKIYLENFTFVVLIILKAVMFFKK